MPPITGNIASQAQSAATVAPYDFASRTMSAVGNASNTAADDSDRRLGEGRLSQALLGMELAGTRIFRRTSERGEV